VPVEQTDREPPTGHAENLSYGSGLFFNEAEGRNRHDQVEAGACVWQGTGVRDLVGDRSSVATTRILYPLWVDIDTDAPAVQKSGECTSEEARAAADVTDEAVECTLLLDTARGSTCECSTSVLRSRRKPALPAEEAL
jgi:hypothetical protein